MSAPSAAADHLVFVAVVGIVAAGYYDTVYRGVPGGDSGELLAEACQLGVAHPPGYPLMVYFARGAMEALRTLGSPAYRVNLASSWLGALAAGMLYSATRRLLRVCAAQLSPLVTRVAAAAAAIAYAFSPLVWLYSVGAEVFVINNFFVAALLLCFARYSQLAAELQSAAAADDAAARATTRRKLERCMTLTAFISGLSLCNQHTSLLLIAPLALWMLLSQRYWLRPRTLLAYSAVAIIGLLPYVHMPLAHTYWRGPGSWGDASTLEGFIKHFLRADYGTFRLLAREGTVESFRERNGLYFKDLAQAQMPKYMALVFLIGAAFALFVGARGAVRACLTARSAASSTAGKHKQQPAAVNTDAAAAGTTSSTSFDSVLDNASAARWVGGFGASAPLTAVALYALYFAIFHSLSNMPLNDPLLYGVHARFWLQPNAFAFMLVAVGLAAAALLLQMVSGSRSGDASAPSRRSTLTSVPIIALAYWWCWQQYSVNHATMAYGVQEHLDGYGRALLAPLPPNAILITGYDFQWTTTRYLQTCEGYRPDVSILNAPVMSYEWFAAHRSSYPRVLFPGTHLTSHLTATHAAGGFSLTDFFVVNLAADCGTRYLYSYSEDPPHESYANKPRELVNWERSVGSGADADACVHASSGVFYAGTMLFAKDDAHTTQFELRPNGLSSQVTFKQAGGANTVMTWRNVTGVGSEQPAHITPPAAHITAAEVDAAEAAWIRAASHFNGSVNVTVYDESTWEAAARTDFWAQGVTLGTWMLEWALDAQIQDKELRAKGIIRPADDPNDPIDAGVTLRGATILEAALAHQQEQIRAFNSSHLTIQPTTYKNIGLAYVKLVRWPHKFPEGVPLPQLPAARAAGVVLDEEKWRTAAAERVLETWSYYLTTPAAKTDPGYSSIQHVVQVLANAANAKSKQQGSASTGSAGAGRAAGAATGTAAQRAAARDQAATRQPTGAPPTQSGMGRVRRSGMGAQADDDAEL